MRTKLQWEAQVSATDRSYMLYLLLNVLLQLTKNAVTLKFLITE